MPLVLMSTAGRRRLPASCVACLHRRLIKGVEVQTRADSGEFVMSVLSGILWFKITERWVGPGMPLLRQLRADGTTHGGWLRWACPLDVTRTLLHRAASSEGLPCSLGAMVARCRVPADPHPSLLAGPFLPRLLLLPQCAQPVGSQLSHRWDLSCLLQFFLVQVPAGWFSTRVPPPRPAQG